MIEMKLEFWLLASLICLVSAVTIDVVLFDVCRKWRKVFDDLQKEYNTLYHENLKLQHEVFKLTYYTPEIDDKKGENENGRK